MRHVGLILIGVILGIGLSIGVPAVGKVTGITLLDWAQILLTFMIAGAFGGMLAAIQLTDIAQLIRSSIGSHWTPVRAGNVCLALAISSFGGMGGAVAAMLVMAMDSKITIPWDPVDMLKFIGVGVVGGFLGFGLLKRIAESLEDWLKFKKEVKDQVAQVSAENAVRERKRSDELISAITKAQAAQAKDAPDGLVADAIAELERVRVESPDNRIASMMLGWLYANKKNNPEKALAILENALMVMKAKGTETTVNVADIHYNRACYFHRLFVAAKDEPERTRLKESMYRELEESVRLKPENGKRALTDPKDFETIKSEERFLALTK